MKSSKRIIAVILCFVTTVFIFSSSYTVSANSNLTFDDLYSAWMKYYHGLDFDELADLGATFWRQVFPRGDGRNEDHSGGFGGYRDYYTNPTESVEDQNGNVTNYYMDGDTTTTSILDSYNQEFTTIHNVTTTNDYEANIALENFLNSYTTNTSNYTYNTEYKSWYYDNTSNTINYDASQTYYNTDNSKYYISIDNSTDEYYLVDIQYSPTYVTVNYIYNNTDNSVQHGNVTNVYYFQLTDGRNSATLSADDVLGLDLSYDVANFEQITDDTYTLSLQHFDNDYSDSSTYGRSFYSENRSTIYVDSSAFGKAVKLAPGSAAGVQIPGLSGYNGLTFDFRIYYDKISSFEVFLGASRLFGGIPDDTTVVFTDYFSDHGDKVEIGASSTDFTLNTIYYREDYPFLTESVLTFDSTHTWPKSFNDLGVDISATKYGYVDLSTAPVRDSSVITDHWTTDSKVLISAESDHYTWYFTHTHFLETQYTWSTSEYIEADFAYSSYVNQWVSMRITILDGFIYYFVNGDLVGVGEYTMPSADKFYIKSSGTVYLDELRVTTGDMVYNGVYVPASAPYDTNKVLALPSELLQGVIYVRSSIPITSWRIGGVRPSNPSKGFLYIPLYSDYSGGQSQLYDGNNWINVDSMIYDGTTTKTTKSFKFSPEGSLEDTFVGSGDTSGSDDDSACSHTWELTESVEPEYDTEGNVTSAGYDLYTCSKCGEVFKDYDSTGPPSNSDSDSGSDSIVPDDPGSFFAWLGQEIGKLVSALIQGFTTLIESTLGVLIDSLVDLITAAVGKITNLVDLFGSFGHALASLWTWLPPDIVNLISAAVTIFLLLAVVRLFIR